VSKRDYYEVLGVSKKTDPLELKKAYRKLALEYHPDRNPGAEAEERFREIQEAYAVLSDPEKKSLYDQFGHEGLRARFGAGGGAPEDIFQGFQSIFEDFFGGGRAQTRSRGEDLLYRLSVDFFEAALGCSKKLDLKRLEICESCEATGCEPGSSPSACATCQGRGQVNFRQGFFSISQACPKCRGTGQVIESPCASCRGAGLQQKQVSLEVKVPAGVDTGVRLRLNAEGNASSVRGAARGDLFVELEVEAHELFERDGKDLYAKIFVPFTTAALGGSIRVPGLETEHEVRVPKLMNSPHLEVLKSQGVVDLRSNRRGDFYIELHIATPDRLSSKAEALIKELHEELQASPTSKTPKSEKKRKKKTSFFGSIF